MELPPTERRKAGNEAGSEKEKNHLFSLGHAEFEMFITHLSRDTKQAVD